MDERLLETIIKLATGIKDDFDQLGYAFRKLLPLIDREHDLIKASNLSALEKLTAEKETLGESINVISTQILKRSEELRQHYIGAFPAKEAPKGAGVNEVVVWLKDFVTSFGEAGLGAQVLSHLAGKLEHQFNDLRAQKTSTQMKIALNSYLTSELLRQHRENIRLIQDLVSEANATYNASGVARKKDGKGVLQVKA